MAQQPETSVAYQDIAIEQELLGAVLLRNSALDHVAGKVRAEDFYYAEHQELFREMERRRALGTPITPTTVREIWQPGQKLTNGMVVEVDAQPFVAAQTNAPFGGKQP